jgi:hypothetical protein
MGGVTVAVIGLILARFFEIPSGEKRSPQRIRTGFTGFCRIKERLFARLQNPINPVNPVCLFFP